MMLHIFVAMVAAQRDGVVPQPGLPEGVLTFSNKECLQLARPSGSPVRCRAVPPALDLGSPSPDDHQVLQILIGSF